jgi:hypothetical protein
VLGIDTDPDRPDQDLYALDADPEPDPDPAKLCGSEPIRICSDQAPQQWIMVVYLGLVCLCLLNLLT